MPTVYDTDLCKFTGMLNRYLVGLFVVFMHVTPALSNGEEYSTVPLPGFFNQYNLRFKQAMDAENGRVWIGTRDLGVFPAEYNNYSINFTLIPNPTSETFELRWSGAEFSALTIREVTGRTLQTEALGRTKAATISILSLPQGIYFVTLQTGDRLTTKKLIRN